MRFKLPIMGNRNYSIIITNYLILGIYFCLNNLSSVTLWVMPPIALIEMVRTSELGSVQAMANLCLYFQLVFTKTS